MQDLPHVTVATVVVRDDRFLMVEEEAAGEVVYNQPAGHVECGESLMVAALRETLEETAWRVTLKYFLGIYQYTSAANGISYVRHCFVAAAEERMPGLSLDAEIVAAHWLRAEEIEARRDRLRSPMVWRAIVDYQQGKQYPLELLHA